MANVMVDPRQSAFNILTPKPAVIGHATSILVGRISAGCCSERGEKAVGRMVIKGTLRGEIRDERPFISYLPPLVVRRKGERGGRIHSADQLVSKPPYATAVRF
ncbi:hypothetical protein AVEN_28520-1 [Araneus ventricosus]|uniref:Uncharacterized protein n=1 Tax=Araneus ventricosus TaxID=182803 RepID=A0A4Y2SAM3_ARAVE|nr:hypothetical protein AVEN_28520-1 [Araneus ventricosus]